MNVTGIIAEYNPFHNGHQYHIEQARQLTQADYIVVIMSGNFVQRGAPAIIDKYQRTQMALANGADLVIELPALYATASAEYFAYGAIMLLDQLNIINSVCFGSECGSIPTLNALADLFVTEPPQYTKALKLNLREGRPFPQARARAAEAYADDNPWLFADLRLDLHTVLSAPNNILGIEYLKALRRLKSPIRPATISRFTAGYHDPALLEKVSSATAIRNHLHGPTDLQLLSAQLPPAAYAILTREYERSFPIFSDDFSLLLNYRLLNTDRSTFSDYADVTPELSDRLAGLINPGRADTFTTLSSTLKTRQITATRARRALLHILLDLRQEDLAYWTAQTSLPYLRVLGFRKDAQALMHSLKKAASAPLITKLAASRQKLSPEGLKLLAMDISSANIYQAVTAGKFQPQTFNEYTRGIIIC